MSSDWCGYCFILYACACLSDLGLGSSETLNLLYSTCVRRKVMGKYTKEFPKEERSNNEVYIRRKRNTAKCS
jgi:hypothetical protein